MTDLAANKSAPAPPPRWLAFDECRAQVPIALLPLEYLALPRGHALDIAARTRAGAGVDARGCWARRAAYRLGQHRILVTEVFLPSIEDRR